ncbi:hypothetical protein [Lacticaseibacillus manihotivorans]|uniref:hypothetical protein n=1 Tax=Lacticaseibacillus manihotivorans TaxID=88233 RepID=UPI0006D0CFE0|nr:hypothetical protein [Lacticaseibacillus manihotivorans]
MVVDLSGNVAVYFMPGRRTRQIKLIWWLATAAIFGVIAASAQWLLLPVILAQVVYSGLINSQKLSQALEITLWTISVFFAQMVLLYQLMQGTTWQLLLLLAVLLIPQVISVWLIGCQCG